MAEITFDDFVQEKGVFVIGPDFIALNYGKKYGAWNDDQRFVCISGNSASYLTFVPESQFPNNVVFNETLPNIKIPEASHVTDSIRYETSMTLEEFVNLLEAGGMKFSSGA